MTQEELNNKLKRLNDLREQINILQKEEKELTIEIKNKFNEDNIDEYVIDDIQANIFERVNTIFDKKSFQLINPETYAEYCSTQTSSYLKIKKIEVLQEDGWNN